MTSQTLGGALSAYRQALASVAQDAAIDEAQALVVLTARDMLQSALQESPHPGAYRLAEIHKLDQQLKGQAAALVKALDFSAYRKSFPRPAEYWWWFLDEILQASTPHPTDWVFKGATTLAWAVSIGLLVTISSRFLLGGAGVAGLSAIALSNLLTLLKARSDLTDAGNEGAQWFFDRFRLSPSWRLRTRFSTTALLAGALFAFWLALPSISRQANRRGQVAQFEGKLGSAEQAYNLAISLNPDNVDAHYNLGTLYEDIQDLQQARTQYLIAIRGDLPEAYSTLARLYLDSPEKNVNKAIALLNQGVRLSNEQQSLPEVRYSLFKNLGWALFQQGRYEQAQSALETVIAIREQPDVQPNNPGSAYCLLAQTLEAQGETATLSVWQRCCQLGDTGTPEENAWLMLARDRLDAEGLDYNETCKSTATPLP